MKRAGPIRVPLLTKTALDVSLLRTRMSCLQSCNSPHREIRIFLLCFAALQVPLVGFHRVHETIQVGVRMNPRILGLLVALLVLLNLEHLT